MCSVVSEGRFSLHYASLYHKSILLSGVKTTWQEILQYFTLLTPFPHFRLTVFLPHPGNILIETTSILLLKYLCPAEATGPRLRK